MAPELSERVPLERHLDIVCTDFEVGNSIWVMAVVVIHTPQFIRDSIYCNSYYECKNGDRSGRSNSTHLFQHSLVLLARNTTRRVAGKEPSLGDMAYPKKVS